MHKLTGLVELIDHLRRMLDEIAIPRLQPADLLHPVFDLFERDAKIDRHLVERLGQMLYFIPGLEIQLLVQPTTSDSLDPLVEQTDGTGNPSRDSQASQHRTPSTPNPYTVT